MPPFRLVATDIDGTLIHDRRHAQPPHHRRPRAALPGRPVVLVTGRPVRWLRQLYDQMAEPLPAICANGAVVYDPDTDEILRAAPLSVDLLLDVTQAAARGGARTSRWRSRSRTAASFWYEEAWPLRWDGEHTQVRVLATPEELTSVPAVKLLARSARHEPGRLRRAGQPHAGRDRRGDALVVERRWWRSPPPG